LDEKPNIWEIIKLDDVLYYEQPTPYIVNDTKYDDKYLTPVLTAGKSFILGYTDEKFGIFKNFPCIIFDDFTTDTKYVDFSFKVKSSAMKILHCNTSVNIKFIFYSIQLLSCNVDTHKRFWISLYSQKNIYLPPKSYQDKVVNLIETLFQQVDAIEEEKQSLLKLIDKAKNKVLDLAMTGKLVKQDPNDEPASRLLEKIFEEKKKLAKEGKIKLSKDELLSPPTSVDNDYYQKMGYDRDINWCQCDIRDVLYYEQPTVYIVKNTRYNDNFKTPVLTAGKSFILGYTDEIDGIYDKVPCIIFDDFTTDTKYVDFNFKVKSSAMKILKNITYTNIKYLYYFIKQIEIVNNTHKRYWISDFSKRKVILPSRLYQDKVVQVVNDYLNSLNQIKEELN